MKKIFTAFTAVSVVLGIFGVYAYFAVVKPLMNLEVEPQSVELVSLDPLAFALPLNVINRGGEAVLPGASLNLYIEEVYVGSGSIPSTPLPSGATKTIVAQIIVSQDIATLNEILSSKPSVSAKVDGTLHAKVLFLSLNIPIPKVPVPVPLDTSTMTVATKVVSILPVLKEHSDEPVREAIESEEFMRKVREKTGMDVTPEEAKNLVEDYLGEEAMDMTIEEAMEKYKASGGNLSGYSGEGVS
ncbi:MAG: hypothetical protein ACE5PM_03915 [Candidatus Hydrothermarchaeales archaeon]